MSNSTFKPTHVRCVRYGFNDSDLIVGKVYKIISNKTWGVEIETEVDKVVGEGLFILNQEFRSNTTSRCRFIYVGPPAILGEPKTIDEGSPK